jgi:hypothetical protein
VAASPPFTHNENGKNSDEREAKGDESSIGSPGIGSGGETKEEKGR